MRACDNTVETRELADECISCLSALFEIDAVRTSLLMSLLSGADRAALVCALDRAESALRRRLD